MNIALDLLQFKADLKTKTVEGQSYLFDAIRKKYLVKTPEELVRQLLVFHLLKVAQYPSARIAIEKELIINQRQKRFDLLVYSKSFQPLILIECKAPKVQLSDQTFRQAATYNFKLKADFLVITNGISTYCCQMNYEEKTYQFLDTIPNDS
ncbi:MAG: type I restriction enzyme HsdR N-terminal domain-containing protein [Bacteroidota bacterium]